MATRSRTPVKPATPPNPAPEGTDENPVQEGAEETVAEESAVETTAEVEPAVDEEMLVPVTLVEGEHFGLGMKQFLKGVTQYVTPEVADRLAEKSIKVGMIRAGRGATTSHIPRFRIGNAVPAKTVRSGLTNIRRR